MIVDWAFYEQISRADSQRDLAQKVKDYIDKRVDAVRAGQTSARFTDCSDADLMLELMARGYGVWRPKND